MEDAGKLYGCMEAVGFGVQQFGGGQQPAMLALRPMTTVLVHKMAFEDDKKLNGKKREEILNLFQERVKLTPATAPDEGPVPPCWGPRSTLSRR